MTPAGHGPTPGGAGDDTGGSVACGRPTHRTVAVGLAVAGVLALSLVLAAGAASATVPAGTLQSGNDTTSPELGNLTKVDQTTVDLEITDDSGVNASSIEAADFALSPGSVSNISTAENGTDVVTTIELAEPIDDDQLHVTIAEDRNVTDDAGNELGHDDTIGRRVYGMDGQAPTVRTFDADAGEDGSVDVSFEASESLDGVTVAFDGPSSFEMSLADFGKAAGFPQYDGSTTPPASGEYTVTLESAADRAGNVGQVNKTETVRVDVTPPNARARIDYGSSAGLSVTLDASGSTDNELLGNVTWNLGDGETAAGERVTHRYEPGNYTVTATVSDHAGNTATDELLLNLTGDSITATRSSNATGAGSVSIDGGGADRPTARIDVTDAEARAAVSLSRDVGDGAPIAATDVLALDELTVTLAENASYGLGLQVEDADAVADVTAVTGGDPLGGLTVIHDVDDDRIANVTFSFGVDRDHVDGATDDPDAVSLFRYHAGEWQQLNTTRTNGTNETYRYRATGPGLSRFAVATVPSQADETDQGEDDTDADDGESEADPADEGDSRSWVGVTDASLNTSAVDPGEAVAVTATIANENTTATTYTAGLTVDGTLADTQPIRVPAENETTLRFVHTPESNGTYDVAVNGTTAGTLTVGGTGDDGGSLLGFLGFFGFLPLGLLQTLVTYVGGVLVAAFLVLKAVALYLGY